MRLGSLVIALFFGCVLHADVMYEKTVITTATSELLTGTEVHHRVFIKGDAARAEASIIHPEQGELMTSVKIYRFDRGVIWTLDMDNRQYTETALADTLESPKKVREPEQVMDNPGITVTHTGVTKTIVGKTCEEVIISMVEISDSVKTEMNVTLWLTQELDSCEELIAFNQKRGAMDKLLSYAGDGREQTTTARLREEMNAVKGFPLELHDRLTISTKDMSMYLETKYVYTKLDDKPISQMVFEIPQGFTRQE